MNLRNIDFIRQTEERQRQQPPAMAILDLKRAPLDYEDSLRTELRISHLVNNRSEPFSIARERLVGNNDLMSINYLQLGFIASAAVCRIHVKTHNGNPLGYGTGFLITPGLLITNNHVLENAEYAQKSLAEFNYQYGTKGLPETSYIFNLQPETFFTTNKELDYTIVAVTPVNTTGEKRLADFGFLRLNEDPAKALISENLTIIQHPGGGFKQIAIRENKMLTSAGDFITYSTDTTEGSSGACVFNDQWQVVAVHHSGVPDKDSEGNWLCKNGDIWQEGMDESLIKWISNEGIRISSILNDLKNSHGNTSHYTEIVNVVPKQTEAVLPNNVPADNVLAPGNQQKTNNPQNITNTMEQQSLSFTIPLEVSIKVGTVQNTLAPATPVLKTEQAGNYEIKKSVEPNYINRNGYQAGFLGDKYAISLHALVENQKDKLAPLLKNESEYVLDYENFSVIINKHRKLCVLTAVNIDGLQSADLKRENSPWIYDPRMHEKYQTGPWVYDKNDLDRGHMVRRLDPVWGPKKEIANDDTFHFPNSAPQHKNLNQKTWLSLEDYILSNTNSENIKASVFTGPVFGQNDIPYRDVLLPLQFWKVVAMVKTNGRLSVTGYLLSQPKEIDAFITKESINEDGFGKFKTYQVPLKQIAELTGIHFEPYYPNDPLYSVGTKESLPALSHEIEKAADIQL